MKRTLLVSLVALLVLTSAVAPASAQLLDDDDLEPDLHNHGLSGHPTFIVEYDDGKLGSVETWVNEDAGRELVRSDNDSNVAVVAAPSYHFSGGLFTRIRQGGFDGFSVDVLAEQSYVEAVHPNYVLSYAEPVSSLSNESDFEPPTIGRFALDAPEFEVPGMAFDTDANRTTMADSRDYLDVDEVPGDGSGQTIAMIDTGANVPGDGTLYGDGTVGSDVRIHNASKNFITGETINASAGNYDAIEDGNGHGSWVASAAAGNPNGTVHDGIAPGADLLILRALDDEGSGETDDIRRAIRYAAENGADVISMSLGSPVDSEPLRDAVAYAQDQGSVVVAATGNSRQTIRWIASPADANESVVAVGATNGAPPSTAEVAYFGQHGPDPGTTDLSGGATQGATVDVVAPGMETVARVASTNGYLQNSTLSGTSMSTPMVAGGVALALEENPSWTVENVNERVQKGAEPIPNASSAEVGHGMFNAHNTIEQREAEEDQEDAMTDAAVARDQFSQSMSDNSGGFTRFIPGVGA